MTKKCPICNSKLRLVTNKSFLHKSSGFSKVYRYKCFNTRCLFTTPRRDVKEMCDKDLEHTYKVLIYG